MTNNIEKLYELAYVCGRCYDGETLEYPPFSSEKQLEMIKWLAFEKRLSLKYINAKWHLYNGEWGVSSTIKYEPFEQALAGLICELWDDLTPEQQAEIKRILE